MGKLLSGHYGKPPEAESIPISLMDCQQKLGLKPSDFVSEGPPRIFEKAFGSRGRYLVFQVEDGEIAGSPVWKRGFYLLPIDAVDVLQAFDLNRRGISFDSSPQAALPVHTETATAPPPEVQGQMDAWVARCMPLFFRCGCKFLELKVNPPWGLRRRWKARLRCPKRCQPPLVTLL